MSNKLLHEKKKEKRESPRLIQPISEQYEPAV